MKLLLVNLNKLVWIVNKKNIEINNDIRLHGFGNSLFTAYTQQFYEHYKNLINFVLLFNECPTNIFYKGKDNTVPVKCNIINVFVEIS